MAVKTARELRNRIAAKWGNTTPAVPMPRFIVMYEVPFLGRLKKEWRGVVPREEAPQYALSRQRIDVVAIGTWTKTDYEIHGFELKVSRADLLHELKDLSKSEHAAKACDRWWLVLGDKSLMQEGDPIPESWGIIAASGRGLRILREAEKQPGLRDPSLVSGIVSRTLQLPRWRTAIATHRAQNEAWKYYDTHMRSYRQQNEDRVKGLERAMYTRGFEDAKAGFHNIYTKEQ